jgi:ankyrin repeat protein
MTAVQIAAKEPSMERVVKSLLERGDVDPNISNSDGEDALMYSVNCRGHDIMKSLLNIPDIGVNRSTALIEAVNATGRRKIDTDKIKLLLDHEGIDVNLQDNSGRAALHVAIFSIKAARILLRREDIDINIPDNDGHTPLSKASSEGKVTVVKLLLGKKGINPNTRDNRGCTPLANVCRPFSSCNRQATSVVRALLSHPHTDPNLVDNDGVSILAKVGEGYYGNIIKSLLRAAGAT